jgi:inorganic triphosphatase YgiF
MDRNELVAIYVRKDANSAQTLKACFVTMNHEEMVVASARSNLEPLFELAFNRAEWRQTANKLTHP